ncbi:hypothetical protein KI387_001386, partial [Taxus chinensis]
YGDNFYLCMNEGECQRSFHSKRTKVKVILGVVTTGFFITDVALVVVTLIHRKMKFKKGTASSIPGSNPLKYPELDWKTRLQITLDAAQERQKRCLEAQSMAISISDFLLCPLTFPPRPYLIVSKISFKISCNAIPTKLQSEDAEEKRQRRHNAMKTFLVKECGLTPSQLTTVISKDPALFRTKSTERAQDALQLLRDSGFTIDQVRKTILRHPCVLAFKVDDRLKPKIELFKTLGLTEEDMGNVISKHPRILSSSIDNNLAPKIPLLIKLFGSKDKLSKAVRRAPFILLYDFQTLEMKFRNMKSVGLLEHEINELVRKFPPALALSKDKLQKNMDFLTNTARFRPCIVVTYTQFLGFSLEKRLKPRYMVFKYLTSMMNDKHLSISLTTMLCMTELEFANRFLINRPDVAELYNKCKGKFVDIEIT